MIRISNNFFYHIYTSCAAERFHHYADGCHITVETDHKPLESITRKNLTNAPPRLMRMLLHIQKYDFTVPGKDIHIADGLSRLPIHGEKMPEINVTIHDITDVSESRLEKIKEVTKCDETLQVLTRTVTNGWPQYSNQCPEHVASFWNFRDEIVVWSMHADVLMKIYTGHQCIEHANYEPANLCCGVESVRTSTMWSRNVTCVNTTRHHSKRKN